MSEHPQDGMPDRQTNVEDWLQAVDATSQFPQLQAIAQGHLERVKSSLEISPEHHQAHVKEVESVTPALVAEETPPALIDAMGAILEVADEAIQGAEAADDYEVINRQELVNAFDSYVSDRARGWGMRKLIRRATLAPMERYRKNLPAEADQSAIDHEVRSMTNNYSLLENISDRSEQDIFKPAMTVCVPVAILKEEPSRITNLLESIHRQQADFTEPLEVILWTNAKFAPNNEAQVGNDASLAYEQLKSLIKGFGAEGQLQLKTALQVVPEAEFSMSKLRGDYMEALAVEAKERGYGFDHPVMWLDADTTGIKHGSLKAIADEVQSLHSLFSRPTTYYSIDWVDDTPIVQADDATRAFAIDEMARRMSVRDRAHVYKIRGSEEARSFRYDDEDYFEESGCSFALGTYLKIGGVVETNPIDETSGLFASAETIGRMNILPYKMRVKREGTRYRVADLKVNLLNARMYLSGRSHYEGLKQTGRLRNRRQGESSIGSDGYMLYSDLLETSTSSAEIDVEHLRKTAKDNIHYGIKIHIDPNLKILDRITNKYFINDVQDINETTK